MKLYQYIIIGVAALSLTACDDFLTVTPKNTETTDNFYQTEAQMDQALTGLYGTLKPIPKYLFAMSELRSDNTWVLTDSKQNDYADVVPLMPMVFLPTTSCRDAGAITSRLYPPPTPSSTK